MPYQLGDAPIAAETIVICCWNVKKNSIKSGFFDSPLTITLFYDRRFEIFKKTVYFRSLLICSDYMVGAAGLEPTDVRIKT